MKKSRRRFENYTAWCCRTYSFSIRSHSVVTGTTVVNEPVADVAMKYLFVPFILVEDDRCKHTVPKSLETIHQAVLYISGEVENPSRAYPLYVSHLFSSCICSVNS